MSGGSFNYLFSKMADFDGFFEHLHDLKRMEQWLREQRKHDAADELLTFIMEIETAQRRLTRRAQYLSEVMRGAEWWCSNDWGEDTFDEMWKEFLEGKE